MYILPFLVTLWCPVGFKDFCAKTTGSHVALHGNISGLVSATDLVKSSKDLANLVVCNEKTFLVGVVDFL